MSIGERTYNALDRAVRALSYAPHNQEAREALGIKRDSKDWIAAETQTDFQNAVASELQALKLEWMQKLEGK